MINKIKEIAEKKFDSFEIVEIKENSTPVSFSAGKLKSLITTEKHGFALRGIKDGKIAFSSTTKPDSAEDLVEQTLSAIPYSPKASFSFSEKQNNFSDPKITDDKITNLSAEKMIDIGNKAVDRLLKLHDKIKVFASVSKSSSDMRIITSNGFDASYKKNDMVFGVGAKLVDGENMLYTGDVSYLSKYISSTEKALDWTEKTFNWGKKNVSVKAGKYKVLFTPSAVTHILGILKASWMGTSVFKKVSPWQDKVGEKIADERLSIFDDGTIDGLPVSSPFDCEGTPSQKTPIIEKGILKGFITDKVTAHRLGIKPTGNGFKRGGGFSFNNDIDAVPVTASSNNVLAPGAKHSDDILAGLNNAILVDGLMGTMMGNALSGMLAGNISLGYLVKDGKVQGRIKDAMLTVNLFEAIKNSIIDISSDTEVTVNWSGNCLVPWMLLDGCMLAVK